MSGMTSEKGDVMTRQGPNVKKLIAHRMACQAIPSGGGIKDGIEFFLSGKIGDAAKEATAWVEQAIALIKTAPGNQYGDDDEAIAGEIIRRIEERQRASAARVSP